MSTDTIEDVVTVKDVQIVARRVTGISTVEVVNYHLSSYSDEKIGFLGNHRTLKIIVKNPIDQKLETLHLFVKSIPYECGPQADYIINDNVFVKERVFYEKVIPLMTENYKGERWSPICYLAKKDALILEDLRHQGYKMFNSLFDDLDLLKSGLATLARLHSCSILTEARLRQRSENLALNEYCPQSFVEGLLNRTAKAYRWCSAGVDIAATVAERLGYDSRKLRISFDRSYETVKPSKIYRNVVGHGDLWKNNMMFDNSSPTRKCVFVDFQIVRYAPIALDILQLLYLNTTREYRERVENDLVEFYHSVLQKTVQDNDVTGLAKISTLEEIKSEIEDLRIYGPIVATLYFPLILLDSKIAKQNSEDPEKYENFIFGNRTNVVLDYMQENEFYKRIIEENVVEVVKMSEKLVN